MATLPSDQQTNSPDRARRIQRVRRVSAAMASACVAVAILLTLAMALYWWTTPVDGLYRQAGIPGASSTDVDPLFRLGGFAISMVPLAALIYGLLAARRCFRAFSAGRIFSREATRSLRTFAVAVAASALLKAPIGAALSVFLSMAASTPARSLVLAVDSETLLSLLFAAMIAVIAWVLSEATDIADENQQFV